LDEKIKILLGNTKMELEKYLEWIDEKIIKNFNLDNKKHQEELESVYELVDESFCKDLYKLITTKKENIWNELNKNKVYDLQKLAILFGMICGDEELEIDGSLKFQIITNYFLLLGMEGSKAYGIFNSTTYRIMINIITKKNKEKEVLKIFDHLVFLLTKFSLKDEDLFYTIEKFFHYSEKYFIF
jgi:hypothetical protein